MWDAPGQNQGGAPPGAVPPQRRQGTPRGRQMARRGTPMMRGRGGMMQQPRFPGGQMPHQGMYRGGPPVRGRGNRGRPF